jgi:hypothetical protein
MSQEQPDFDFLNEDSNEKNKDLEIDTKTETRIHMPDDGLSFDCEICMDREGGCPTCGWGKNL